MWKKDGEATEGTPTASGTATPAAPASAASPSSTPAAGRSATIGKAITIKGEVSGDEDLLIQGRVDGSVELGAHAVTVGSEGRVTASITGRIVTVEGRVDGDIQAQERVVLRESSHVEGDITSPRLVLEDGAVFKGGVDMGEQKPAKTSKPSQSDSSSSTSTSSSSTPSGSAKKDGSDASNKAGSDSSKKDSSKARATAGASGD